jgi:hypothetical protein
MMTSLVPPGYELRPFRRPRLPIEQHRDQRIAQQHGRCVRAGGWTIYEKGWHQQVLDAVCMLYFGGLHPIWAKVMAARWSANPRGMLWPETDAALVASGGGAPPASRSAA